MTQAPFTPTDPEGGLILATRLPGGARLGWDDLVTPNEPPPVWIHLDRTKERAKRWVSDAAGLDPLAVHSLLAEETRPRVQRFDTGERSGVVVILRGVNLNEGAEPDELIAIRLWVEPTRVISLRQFRFGTIAELRERADRGQAPTTAGAFLAGVVMGLASRMDPVVTNLHGLLDTIEESMIDRDSDQPAWRAQLADVRRQAITLRRYLAPQRDSLLSLAIDPPGFLTKRDAAEIRVAAEQIARVVDALEETRDRAAVTQDELRARHEARLSRTLYLLTIVATVALPLGLLTGLLGINVGGIPLADSHWGFVIICVLLVGIAAVEVLIFKAMRWL
ncbi:MAG: CorA family divalent cation transporter [Planctomycetota bacterium]